MNEKLFKKTIYLGFAAGFCGAILGIGGALILVPAWLNMGMDKDEATSTSPPLILSSSFISVFVAALSGMYDSGLDVFLYFVLAFFGSFFVKSISILT